MYPAITNGVFFFSAEIYIKEYKGTKGLINFIHRIFLFLWSSVVSKPYPFSTDFSFRNKKNRRESGLESRRASDIFFQIYSRNRSKMVLQYAYG